MAYVDGYLVPVKTAKKEEYREMATLAMEIFKENGALQVCETWADDVPPGKVTSFPLALKLEADETVVFSWVVWPSKDVRVIGMKKFMEDPRLHKWDMNNMPFDGQRMIFGGFETLVQG
ncbi:MAG: DUF1428 domain-containing protein [Pseudomonadota bacterium]